MATINLPALPVVSWQAGSMTKQKQDQPDQPADQAQDTAQDTAQDRLDQLDRARQAAKPRDQQPGDDTATQ